MTKLTIELESEQIDAIVKTELATALEYLEWAAMQASKGNDYVAVFSLDPVEDQKQINKRINAFKLVKEWYTGE